VIKPEILTPVTNFKPLATLKPAIIPPGVRSRVAPLKA